MPDHGKRHYRYSGMAALLCMVTAALLATLLAGEPRPVPAGTPPQTIGVADRLLTAVGLGSEANAVGTCPGNLVEQVTRQEPARVEDSQCNSACGAGEVPVRSGFGLPVGNLSFVDQWHGACQTYIGGNGTGNCKVDTVCDKTRGGTRFAEGGVWKCRYPAVRQVICVPPPPPPPPSAPPPQSTRSTKNRLMVPSLAIAISSVESLGEGGTRLGYLNKQCGFWMRDGNVILKFTDDSGNVTLKISGANVGTTTNAMVLDAADRQSSTIIALLVDPLTTADRGRPGNVGPGLRELDLNIKAAAQPGSYKLRLTGLNGSTVTWAFVLESKGTLPNECKNSQSTGGPSSTQTSQNKQNDPSQNNPPAGTVNDVSAFAETGCQICPNHDQCTPCDPQRNGQAGQSGFCVLHADGYTSKGWQSPVFEVKGQQSVTARVRIRDKRTSVQGNFAHGRCPGTALDTPYGSPPWWLTIKALQPVGGGVIRNADVQANFDVNPNILTPINVTVNVTLPPGRWQLSPDRYSPPGMTYTITFRQQF